MLLKSIESGERFLEFFCFLFMFILLGLGCLFLCLYICDTLFDMDGWVVFLWFFCFLFFFSRGSNFTPLYHYHDFPLFIQCWCYRSAAFLGVLGGLSLL